MITITEIIEIEPTNMEDSNFIITLLDKLDIEYEVTSKHSIIIRK